MGKENIKQRRFKMKNLYMTTVNIEDKGEVFTRTEEVVSESLATLRDDLIKQLNKYRRAMGLSKNFQIKRYDARHIGWA